MPSMDVKSLIEEYKALKADRSQWESWWEDLARFCIPRKAKIVTDRTTGEQFEDHVYDSTARDSIKIMASGFMGNLTNPAQQWFKLKTRDENLMDDQDVRLWLSDSTRRMLSLLATTNFYQEIHEFYMSLGVFGTTGFFTEEDSKDGVRFYARNIKELFFTEDEKGRTDYVYRFFKLTARQANSRWPDKAGKNIKDALDKGDLTNKFDFLHVIGPRGEREPGKEDAQNKPFFSIWINVEEELKVAEGGFEEFPINVPRFTKEDEEKHGYSPAMDVLADIRSANEIKKILLRAGAKQGDPPIVLPHDGYMLPLDFNASGVNFKNTGMGSTDDRIEFLRPDADLGALQAILQDDRQTIRKAFFVDLFKALEVQRERQKTATEVAELVQEAMVLLGPVVGRIMREVLSPVIERTFGIMQRNGMLSPIPDGLDSIPLQIEYVSRLEVAQRFSESQNLQLFLSLVGNMSQFKPEVLDKINEDEAVDLMAKFTGVDPQVLNSDEVIKQIREQRAQIQQQQLEAQQIEQGATVAEKAGKATKSFADSERDAA